MPSLPGHISSDVDTSLQHQLNLPPAPAKTRTCKRVLSKDVAISFLLILVIILIIVLLATKRTEQWSCAHGGYCSAQCPHQWIGYEEKCYFFSEEKLNWTSSQAFCSVYNASLASFEQEEKDFVMRIKDEGTYWIGLKKTSNQSWVWPNGEKSVLTVTGGSDCVYLDNEVSSSGCHAELPFICSKAAGCTLS
ncbi:C-type lectin domain family 2 member D-like [Heteronotia binoei]|uniref:C-type lectin domain family 2 member D-like n=1 Tax=Heteronotia binoei TaxID=13085 RepID=UPI00292ECCC0|nr:C-type lectin domain family 2 member D-like [Heteronotia binoei]